MVSTKSKIVAIVILILVLIGLMVGIHLITEHSTPPAPAPRYTAVASAPADTTPTPVAVPQPPSAKDVAKSIECTSFHDLGPAAAGAVVDSGWCMIGLDRFAIDTFGNKMVRDNWIQAAEGLGVRPWRETSTAVIYPSVS